MARTGHITAFKPALNRVTNPRRSLTGAAVPEDAQSISDCLEKPSVTVHQAESSLHASSLQRCNAVVASTSLAENRVSFSVSSETLAIGLVVTQIVTLVGSLVGGHLARKRRLDLESLNSKLREVVHELRKRQEQEQQALVCEADPEEGVSAYQHALEASLASPAAAHPLEGFGVDGSSVAVARRKVSKLLYGAKTAHEEDNYDVALQSCQDALALAHELADKRALRAILRVQARTQKSRQNYEHAIQSLQDALNLSDELDEHYGDVDTLGALADLYVELGRVEEASGLYDRLIEAIQVEDLSAPSSSSWDC